MFWCSHLLMVWLCLAQQLPCCLQYPKGDCVLSLFSTTKVELAAAWTGTAPWVQTPGWQDHGWAIKLSWRGIILGLNWESRSETLLLSPQETPATASCPQQEIEPCSQSPAASEQWVEFPLSVQRGLFVTREITSQGREKRLSGDIPHTVPLRTDSIGNLFWGLSPVLPLKESSVKRMKINLILLSRSGWREPQIRYWKTKTGFFYQWQRFVLPLHSTLF